MGITFDELVNTPRAITHEKYIKALDADVTVKEISIGAMRKLHEDHPDEEGNLSNEGIKELYKLCLIDGESGEHLNDKQLDMLLEHQSRSIPTQIMQAIMSVNGGGTVQSGES